MQATRLLSRPERSTTWVDWEHGQESSRRAGAGTIKTKVHYWH